MLFDQGTPVPLRRALIGHEVKTAHERGWSRLANGELLRAAEAARFAVLVTTDKNLRYQQHLPARRIAVVVLGTTSWPRIQRVSELVAAVVDQAARDAGFIEVPIP
ncbi:MAG: hypothetical protein NW201_02900 [Gemmatimonadales bacterium]|nr:hypothetical protein [Gemmatimonadales bacterium]